MPAPPFNRFVPFLALALLGSACEKEAPGKVGEACTKTSPCVKGLRCSAKKKCYLPVDCRRLGRRLGNCVAEVVYEAYPSARGLGIAQRTKVLRELGKEIQTEVVKECKLDRAGYLRKYSVARKQARSYGQDRQSAAINRCLKRSDCKAFSRCLLALGRTSPKRGARRVKVLPVPQPMFPTRSPSPVPDAGVAPPAMGKPVPAPRGRLPAMSAMPRAPRAMPRPPARRVPPRMRTPPRP